MVNIRKLDLNLFIVLEALIREHSVTRAAARLGLSQWPVIPRGTDWKHGICEALGWPHVDQADIAAAWRRIRGRVRDWTDLDAALIGRVEELIDFVTQP